MRYLTQHTNIDRVPEHTIVDRIPATELTLDEAMFIVRLRGVLLDDYLIGEIEVSLADISHGVEFHTEVKGDTLQGIAISRTAPAVRLVVECYRTARDVFTGFVKDFVREHLYPHIRPYILFINPAGQRCPVSKTEGQQGAFPATGERLRGNRGGVGGLHFGKDRPQPSAYDSQQASIQSVAASKRVPGRACRARATRYH